MNITSGKNVVVIPARGGSKGIPRKNLRPVAGFPMIYYSINAALNARSISRVIVTTEDEEIALFSERFGAEVIMRPPDLADDVIPLDPVILHAVTEAEEENNEEYHIVVTVQPTSPLIQSFDIDTVVEKIKNDDLDTAQTVVDDRHLCWTVQDGKASPLYNKRVNRQLLPVNYRETGAVIGCTRGQIDTGSRIGKKVGLVEVPQNRSFDIDSFSDLFLCEAMLNRKKIVFTVIGHSAVGLGHAFRAVMLAHELVNYELLFICDEQSDLAINYIREQNYNVLVCPNGCEHLATAVIEQNADMVINDILDTEKAYIESIKQHDIKVVNFEDLGSGAVVSDLVVNALYPDVIKSSHILSGEKYFCVRDEFLYINRRERTDSVQRVLLTFGGVDEGNLTTRVLSSIYDFCHEREIEVVIVLGPGFENKNALESYMSGIKTLRVKVYDKTKRISDLMNSADIAVTSGGRTVLELASLEVPTIVICQNKRETTHSFASSRNGVLNLGYRGDVSREDILSAFDKMVNDNNFRSEMSLRMAALDLTLGKQRVIKKLVSLIK